LACGPAAELPRLRSITAFADDLEVRFGAQVLADAAPRDRLVVDDET